MSLKTVKLQEEVWSIDREMWLFEARLDDWSESPACPLSEAEVQMAEHLVKIRAQSSECLKRLAGIFWDSMESAPDCVSLRNDIQIMSCRLDELTERVLAADLFSQVGSTGLLNGLERFHVRLSRVARAVVAVDALSRISHRGRPLLIGPKAHLAREKQKDLEQRIEPSPTTIAKTEPMPTK